jgi:hypothetical protein
VRGARGTLRAWRLRPRTAARTPWRRGGERFNPCAVHIFLAGSSLHLAATPVQGPCKVWTVVRSHACKPVFTSAWSKAVQPLCCAFFSYRELPALGCNPGAGSVQSLDGCQIACMQACVYERMVQLLCTARRSVCDQRQGWGCQGQAWVLCQGAWSSILVGVLSDTSRAGARASSCG